MVNPRCYVKGDIRLRRFPTYFLILFLAACNLSQVDEPSNIETPIPTRTLSVQDVESTEESSTIRQSPTLAPFPNQAEESEEACTPPDDWYEYTVEPGDNLSRIASLTDSTVDELIAANCLDDPNRIRVGTTILVPSEPD
jgi:LysM repeat protein